MIFQMSNKIFSWGLLRNTFDVGAIRYLKWIGFLSYSVDDQGWDKCMNRTFLRERSQFFSDGGNTSTFGVWNPLKAKSRAPKACCLQKFQEFEILKSYFLKVQWNVLGVCSFFPYLFYKTYCIWLYTKCLA